MCTTGVACLDARGVAGPDAAPDVAPDVVLDGRRIVIAGQVVAPAGSISADVVWQAAAGAESGERCRVLYIAIVEPAAISAGLPVVAMRAAIHAEPVMVSALAAA